jgi:hypothetical protein
VRREEAIRARNDRKALSALKARRLVRHTREAARFEQAELDDLTQGRDALNRAAR